MIAFLEGGMTLPMGRVTRNYLINHKLTPHQYAPNLFTVLGYVDALNEQMGLMWSTCTSAISSPMRGIT